MGNVNEEEEHVSNILSVVQKAGDLLESPTDAEEELGRKQTRVHFADETYTGPIGKYFHVGSAGGINTLGPVRVRSPQDQFALGNVGLEELQSSDEEAELVVEDSLEANDQENTSFIGRVFQRLNPKGDRGRKASGVMKSKLLRNLVSRHDQPSSKTVTQREQ